MVGHKSHNNFFERYNFYCFILIFSTFLIASLNFESDFFKFYFQFDDLENILKYFTKQLTFVLNSGFSIVFVLAFCSCPDGQR